MFDNKICFTKNQAYEFLESFGYRPTFICSDKQIGALIENDMLQGGSGFFIVWNGFMIDGLKSSFKFTIFDVVADDIKYYIVREHNKQIEEDLSILDDDESQPYKISEDQMN